MFKFLRSPWIVSAFVLMTLGYPLWELFDRVSPVIRFEGTVTPQDPAPGDTIRVVWHISSTRTCSGTVRRQIIDSHGLLHDYNSVPAIAEEGDRELIRDIKLPTVLPDGPTTYKAYLTFYCNPLHWFWPLRETTTTLTFNVKNRDN